LWSTYAAPECEFSVWIGAESTPASGKRFVGYSIFFALWTDGGVPIGRGMGRLRSAQRPFRFPNDGDVKIAIEREELTDHKLHLVSQA
jgi:hypothetical protein